MVYSVSSAMEGPHLKPVSQAVQYFSSLSTGMQITLPGFTMTEVFGTPKSMQDQPSKSVRQNENVYFQITPSPRSFVIIISDWSYSSAFPLQSPTMPDSQSSNPLLCETATNQKSEAVQISKLGHTFSVLILPQRVFAPLQVTSSHAGGSI